MITAEDFKAMTEEMVEEDGEIITIRRYTGSGINRPSWSVDVRASVKGYSPDELQGGILQNDRRVVVPVQQMIDKGFPLNLGKVTGSTDVVVIRGRECSIVVADDTTRRDHGLFIAYELQVRG